MQWINYFRNIVARYHVVVAGWPDNIPFENLSKASNSLTQLEGLLQKWEDGTTYWKNISEEQVENERDALKASGQLAERTCQTQSDKGKKHKQPANLQQGRHKSSTTVADPDDSEDNTQPAPGMSHSD